MENRNGYYRQNTGLWSSFRDGDFEEADVWAVIKERKDSNYSQVGQSIKEIETPLNVQRRDLSSAVRMIPGTSNSKGNSSSTSNSSRDVNKRVKQQSAPVKIPDWSKINKNKSKKKSHKYDYHDDSDDDHVCVDDGDEYNYDYADDEEDVYDSKVPPHEFIADRLATSQISSFSVFEGVGRKLKGRDLSEVRNTVLTKTGFLE